MTQLIATNQLTLTNVNDGQTPYVHWAYSDNADGTGLTLTDNGQRYIGQYTDYTQTDSTDKTKYRWADRWAKIEVGGKNVIRNSAFGNAFDSSDRFTVGGVTYVNKLIPSWSNLYNGGMPNPATSYHAIYRESFKGKGPVIEFNESNGSRNWKAISAILQASDLISGNYTFSADIYATDTGTKIRFGFYYYNKSGARNFHSGQTIVYITTINSWHRVSGAVKLNNDIDFTKIVLFYIYAHDFTSNSILYLTKPQLEEGTVATTWQPAPEDITNEISSVTGRVSNAETAITQNAQEISKRLTSTQVNQAILVDKQIKDTRSDNQSPQWYWTNYPKQTVEEFKASAVIGLTSESTYAILTTNVHWTDSSGGKVKQTAKTDRATFERYGTGSTWDAWTKIANAGDLADYTTKTEFQTDIASKADQALTQEQLNALNEKNQILEAEMKAKASMEAFSEFEKAYQSFVKANADGQAKAEADLVEAGRRIEMLVTQVGGLAELKTFIDTYMSSSNEGLIIGKNDASSTIKVSSDRISMFSAGKEVMYISQGVININNGIFTASVQIGKFRTEQYHLNADMNVMRYVG